MHMAMSGARWQRDYIQMRPALRKARIDADLSQSHVAGRMGISTRTLIRLEMGEADPNIRTICAWASAVGKRVVLTDLSLDETE